MNHRLRRLAARFLAMSLLAATLFMVDLLASPTPAEARCNGVGNPVRSTFSYNGVVRVSETPASGTCNGNQTYTGTLRDERADGNCVEVWFMETGTGWIRPAGGVSCGQPSTFEWVDHNGNSRAYQQFCIYNRNTGVTVACGWGTSVGFGSYGVNHGY